MAARHHNWLAIRTAYVVHGKTAQECADEFHVDVTTVKKRASKEGWTTERHRNATQGAEVVAGEMRAAVRSQIESHAGRANRALEMADKLADKIESAIENLKPEDLRGVRSVTETFHRFSEALSKGFGSDRLVRGIKDGNASDADVTASGKRKVRRLIMVTPEEVEAQATQSA